MGARPNAGHSCGQLSFPFYFFSIVNTCILNANLTIPFHYLSTPICERRLCMSFTTHISSHLIQFAYGAHTPHILSLQDCTKSGKRSGEMTKSFVFSQTEQIEIEFYTIFSTYILFHFHRNVIQRTSRNIR